MEKKLARHASILWDVNLPDLGQIDKWKELRDTFERLSEDTKVAMTIDIHDKTNSNT